MPPATERPFGLPRRELGELVRRHADEVMRAWAPVARTAIAGAKEAPSLILTDVLRESLTDIADALDALHEADSIRPLGGAARLLAYAALHGSERAAVPRYDVGQVVREYRLLRHTLLQVLARRSALTAADIHALGDCVDHAIETAADAFMTALREAQSNQIRGLVHDLLNPLSVIRMDIQLIARNVDDPERVRKTAEQSLESVERIATMAGALLDASRLEAGEALKLEIEEIDLREPVRSVADSARVAYGDRVRVQSPDDPVHGLFATAGVVRVLENLITNAIKYGDPEAEITVTLSQDAERAVLRVHNWGEPIPPEQRDRIFGEFIQSGETTRPQGWGIGLAVVRAVAEASGGEVDLESDRESGTTFSITLRKDGGPQIESVARPPSEPGERGRR